MKFIPEKIGGVMVSMLASTGIDRGSKPRSGQPKDYIIGIFYFSTKHTTLRRKSKDWMAWNQDNVSCGVQCLSTEYPRNVVSVS